MSSPPWTSAEDNVIRESWGRVTARELSQRLPGRSPSAIKQRARRLDLSAHRGYTAEQLRMIRDMYHTHTAAQIAAAIHGRPRAALSIYRIAHKLGLRKRPSHPPELIDQVRQLHAEGLNDYEIAARVGMCRDQVHAIRYERLKLPPNEASVLEACRRGVKTQYRKLGIATAGELRARAYRKFAAGRGWPEDLRPRGVQIIELLAISPPLCRREIAAGVGMPWKGSRKSLVSNDPEGSYLAHLIKRGLVVSMPRAKVVHGHGSGRSCHLYTLTPAALEIIQRRARCETTA